MQDYDIISSMFKYLIMTAFNDYVKRDHYNRHIRYFHMKMFLVTSYASNFNEMKSTYLLQYNYFLLWLPSLQGGFSCSNLNTITLK